MSVQVGSAATKFPTIFEVRLEHATLFKNLVEAISDLFSEAYFNFSSRGLDVLALDSSDIALVALLLRAEAINHYHCDRALSVGLSLADMAKAFRCTNNDDTLTIKPVDDRFNILAFKFESPNGVILDNDFNRVDIEYGPFEINEFPESKYQAIVRMPSAMFMDICNKLSSGERDTVVIISVDKERVSFFTGGKTGSSSIVCRPTQTVDKTKELTLIKLKERVSLTFDLRCMNSFSKASTLSDQVTISLSSIQPTVFEYKIAEMGYIRYYLSPDEMQNDEDDTAKEDKMQNEGDEMQN
ncbi:proliferating cell nuclear antigen isoform X2 [Brachypodium distachyon]|uniref:proliferating cell nuclear antigen isoform X2 n=1 Tax=Brachypodium distachyon TaxID=15368 RepID=UPI000234F549|nr:proliferating cell nuclear antigen isoform X2 [Brachypodium distachyon]|eukprot:XP_003576993.1 proliferating cell nuclear antigen isoform X2 [Brachypodium distachyon]